MALSRPNVNNEVYDRNLIERIILNLGDLFHIRVQWDKNTAIWTGACAVAGGIIGGFAGSVRGAAIGAGMGGVTGFVMVSLRDVWSAIRDKIEELIYIVFNYLRRLNADDYRRALDILMACRTSRRELVSTIIEFLADKLGRTIISSLTAA